MSERHFHGKSHGRLHVDEPKIELTEAEKLAVKIDVLKAMLNAINPEKFPNFYATTKLQLEDAKSEAETARDAEWLITDDSELAPVMTFNGEADEVRPYHSNSGNDIPF